MTLVPSHGKHRSGRVCVCPKSPTPSHRPSWSTPELKSKWRKHSNPLGVPVWSPEGIICTGETYKDKVKLTFAKGASLEDPANLFNASLGGNVRRAIDLHERAELDEGALEDLVPSCRRAQRILTRRKASPTRGFKESRQRRLSRFLSPRRSCRPTGGLARKWSHRPQTRHTVTPRSEPAPGIWHLFTLGSNEGASHQHGGLRWRWEMRCN